MERKLISYILLSTPEPVSKLGVWERHAGKFTDVVGYSALGDFFLRDPGTGQYAVLFAIEPEIVPLSIYDGNAFYSGYLQQPIVREKVLREDHVKEIADLLGAISENKVYIPTPFPFLGGDEHPGSYIIGDVWTYADMVGQMQDLEP